MQSKQFENLIQNRIAMVEQGARKRFGRRFKREKLRTAVMNEIIEAEMVNNNCSRSIAIWRLNNINPNQGGRNLITDPNWSKAWVQAYNNSERFRKLVDFFARVSDFSDPWSDEELSRDPWSLVQPGDNEWSAE